MIAIPLSASIGRIQLVGVVDQCLSCYGEETFLVTIRYKRSIPKLWESSVYLMVTKPDVVIVFRDWRYPFYERFNTFAGKYVFLSWKGDLNYVFYFLSEKIKRYSHAITALSMFLKYDHSNNKGSVTGHSGINSAFCSNGIHDIYNILLNADITQKFG